MSEPDPVSWIREIGTDVPWEYDLLQAFVRAYLCAGPRRREQAERALPGVAREAALWQVMRSHARRN
jgi:hypothetical protein